MAAEGVAGLNPTARGSCPQAATGRLEWPGTQDPSGDAALAAEELAARKPFQSVIPKAHSDAQSSQAVTFSCTTLLRTGMAGVQQQLSAALAASDMVALKAAICAAVHFLATAADGDPAISEVRLARPVLVSHVCVMNPHCFTSGQWAGTMPIE